MKKFHYFIVFFKVFLFCGLAYAKEGWWLLWLIIKSGS
jgi:hypothetical protein